MSKIKTLASLFRSTAKSTRPSTTTTTSTTAGAAAAATETSLAGDVTLKQYVSSLNMPSPSISHFITKRSVISPEPPSDPLSTTLSPASYPFLSILDPEGSGSDSENETNELAQNIRSILRDGGSAILPDLQGTSSDKSSDDMLNIPFVSSFCHNIKSREQKEITRSRKQRWFKHNHGKRMDQRFTSWAYKIGANSAVEVLGKLGYENLVEGYNALIKVCIDEARRSDDEDVKLERISIAFQLLKTMKEQGCQLEEEAYGPCFLNLIEMGMVEKFYFFSKIIKDDNPSSLARFGYYEMLLHIRMKNREKIQELCNHISNNLNETINLQENYLLALSEMDQKNELLQLLEIVDITKVSSLDYVVSIFKSLGRLLLESQAEKFLLKFKECDYGMENISTLISIYATSIPNLAVEDVILKFKNLHSMLEMTPYSKSYEKLIIYSCELLKVHEALDVVDQICRENLTLSVDTLNSILHVIEKSFEFTLVQRIYSLICHHNLQPNNETFRSMINLRVKMKDFAGAFDMLDDLKKFNLMPTSGMYNAIMAGYFRKKNINSALMVFKKMELADVKPDSQTYSYLIANCDSEDQIIKYYEEAKSTGVQVSKQICMSLVNAYAACGLFEKAKQVLGEVPDKDLNEIKSVLVSALASHGQMSDALDVYEEIKKNGGNIEPKAVICLIEHEHLQSKGELSRLLKLLKELQHPEYWLDGCCRVILYCIRNKHVSSAVDLLKQLNDRFGNDELAMQVIFDEVFSLIAEIDPTDLQIGLDLLQFMKDELCFSPSRKSLDFLLSTCAKAKDLHNSLLIWEEYQAAGYPYNVTSYLRMYQAVLASGDHKFAKNMLPRISKDDLHVRMVIEACQKTYIESTSVKEREKKKKGRKKKEQIAK